MFHPISLVITLVVLMPNLFFFLMKPTNMVSAERDEPLLDTLEGIGRLGVFILPVFFKIDLEGVMGRIALYGMILTAGFYYIGWFRYFVRGREYKLLFSPLWGVPVPLAISPVLYYIFASLILHSFLVLLAAVVFGCSHVVLARGAYRVIADKKM